MSLDDIFTRFNIDHPTDFMPRPSRGRPPKTVFFQFLAGVGFGLSIKEDLQAVVCGVGFYLAAVKLPAHIADLPLPGQGGNALL